MNPKLFVLSQLHELVTHNFAIDSDQELSVVDGIITSMKKAVIAYQWKIEDAERARAANSKTAVLEFDEPAGSESNGKALTTTVEVDMEDAEEPKSNVDENIPSADTEIDEEAEVEHPEDLSAEAGVDRSAEYTS